MGGGDVCVCRLGPETLLRPAARPGSLAEYMRVLTLRTDRGAFYSFLGISIVLLRFPGHFLTSGNSGSGTDQTMEFTGNAGIQWEQEGIYCWIEYLHAYGVICVIWL